MSTPPDVLIVGGGIIGSSCAYHLSLQGLKVVLFEREEPAAGSSSSCDGLILVGDKDPGSELELGLASRDLWQALREDDDFSARIEGRGLLMLAGDEGSLDTGKALTRSMQANGVKAEWLEIKDLLGLEPRLDPGLKGGIFFPEDLQVDPRRATLAFLKQAKRRGAQVKTGEGVRELLRDEDGEQVHGLRTKLGEYHGGAVLIAAGVWSRQVLEGISVKVPIRPRKGHILVLERVEPIIHHPMLELGYADTVHKTQDAVETAFVAERTAEGTLLIGSSREFCGYDTEIDLDVLTGLARRAAHFLPDLPRISAIRSYAGLRPWSPDNLPLIGPIPGYRGLWIAAGHEGAGVGLAPITGRLIASLMASNSPDALAEAVAPDRFGSWAAEPSGSGG